MNTADTRQVNNAIITGNLIRLIYLIKKFGITNYDNALIISVKYGHLHVIRYLVEDCGTDVNIEEDSILYYSVVIGRFDIIQYLIGHGLRIHDLPMHDIGIALSECIAGRHIKVFKYLVMHGAALDIAIRISIEYGELELIEYLLERGAALDVALAASIEVGNLELVKYIVGRGADVHSIHKTTIQHMAIRGRPTIINYLNEQGAGIYTNVKKTKLVIFNDLIEQLTNINTDDAPQRNPKKRRCMN
jgi:ankyrin repeat protein